MLLQLDLECDEVVDWIQAEEVSICAADKDMLFDCLWLVVTNRYRTTYRLVSHWLYLTLLPQ